MSVRRGHLLVELRLKVLHLCVILIRLIFSLDHVAPVCHYLLRGCGVQVVEDLGLDPARSLLALVLLSRLDLKSLAGSRHCRNKLKFL